MIMYVIIKLQPSTVVAVHVNRQRAYMRTFLLYVSKTKQNKKESEPMIRWALKSVGTNASGMLNVAKN